ncbi:MAG: SGNH/GDSL hydrolase family protein [Bacteroidales bacterium]|nr:SGNH/GDSL hydrolase family protein [Bacteroidales bacterium]MDD4491332.1 SGNH/GDSL hydrolase family protein [Bacteroidales bacterium]
MNTNFLPAQNNQSQKYYDAGTLMILGRGYDIPDSSVSKTDSLSYAARFSRLPIERKSEFRKDLWDIGRSSAGMAVRFSSNSTSIAARWTLVQNASMGHMPSTGIKGMDLYTLDGDKWIYIGTARPSAKIENNSFFIKGMKPEQREYIAYFPLYDGVTNVEIGIDSTAQISKPKNNILVRQPEKKGSILFYGTSITQGGCATRPGMGYTAILERMTGRETFNLGFSGNGRLDKSMAKTICDINASIVVLDCLPNCTDKIVRDSAYIFIKMILDKRPATEIFMVENPEFPQTAVDMKMAKELKDEDAEWLKVYEGLRKEGYKKLHYVQGAGLIGNDNEPTVDGVHLTDLGFLRFSQELYKHLRKVL